MPRRGVTPGRLRKVGAEIHIDVEEVRANVAKVMNRASGVQAKKVFMQAAEIAVKEIKDLAPVLTGRLRDSIAAEDREPTKPFVVVLVKRGRGGAPHAHLVEYGHGGRSPAKAKPYFRPGLNASRAPMAATIATGMRDLITKP